MDLGIRDRVALVCASSKGIGRATAFALAEEGVKLALCARGEDALQDTAAAIRTQTGAETLAIAADLRRAEDIEAVFSQTIQRYGRLDILVTNVGGPPSGSFERFDDAAWQQAFETLLLSVVRLCRLAVPEMRSRRWGRIVNVTSTSVKQPIPGLILSNSLRAAVTGLAKTLASEVAADGITVNNVAPGRILTDRLTSRYAGDAETTRREAAVGVPMARVGEPEEMAGAICYLCGEAAAYITGVTLHVDGGLTQSVL